MANRLQLIQNHHQQAVLEGLHPEERSLQQFGASTHVGKVRDNNEDSYVCDAENSLWVVADGMGGLGFGEVASAITSYTLTTQLRTGQGVNQTIELAHQRIKEYAETQASGTNMGTTLVLLLSQGNRYNVFWVGDSRAYLYGESLKQISVDHSLVQNLIERGELTEEEARFDSRKNAVTRALGVQEIDTVRADSISDCWHLGEKILLCSDGLSDLVTPQEIEKVLKSAKTDQEKTDTLVDLALAAGGKDNITVVLISAPDNTSLENSDTQTPAEVSSDKTYVPQ
ncbi:MAG: serine/threonine protein phosphatase PrpC [Candidatus Azotimanducaceae bacterium]